MKENTITLEIIRNGDRLSVTVKTADVICSSEEITAPMDKIGKRCADIAGILNTAGRKGALGPVVLDRLRTLGGMLWDELFGPRSKENLKNSDADFMILEMGGNLVHIPWELVCLDRKFLCERFCIGRGKVRVEDSPPKSGIRSLAREKIGMLILADPKNDLAEAVSEGLRLKTLAERSGKISPALYAQITPDEIREKIRNYDFVHFAGHADYNPDDPDSSGWELNGVNFRASDIRKMEGGDPMPAFVFSNACQSARTEEWVWREGMENDSFGLANAFLRAGVRHYLGTFWEVTDEPSSRFSQAFYERLLSGLPIGEAVRNSRRAMIEEGADICWASYLLYGDPTYRYFGKPRGRQSNAMQPAAEKIPKRSGCTKTRLRKLPALAWAAIVLLLLAGGYSLASGYFAKQAKQELLRRADARQLETMKLLGKLTESAGPAHICENTVATVFDPDTFKGKTEKKILFAVTGLIRETGSAVLERESLDVILRELLHRESGQNTLCIPNRVLILEVHDPDSWVGFFTRAGPLVFIKVVDTKTGILKDRAFIELEAGSTIRNIKKQLAPEIGRILKTE